MRTCARRLVCCIHEQHHRLRCSTRFHLAHLASSPSCAPAPSTKYPIRICTESGCVLCCLCLCLCIGGKVNTCWYVNSFVILFSVRDAHTQSIHDTFVITSRECGCRECVCLCVCDACCKVGRTSHNISFGHGMARTTSAL